MIQLKKESSKILNGSRTILFLKVETEIQPGWFLQYPSGIEIFNKFLYPLLLVSDS